MEPGRHSVALPVGRYRLVAIAGSASDGTPGETSTVDIDFTEPTTLEIEIGASGGPDAPPGMASITDLRTGRVLVIAPPLEPRWSDA